MKITDNKGCEIIVTDLNAAVKQADDFRQMKHKNEGYEILDSSLNEYWQDIYEKLMALKEQQG